MKSTLVYLVKPKLALRIPLIKIKQQPEYI